VWERNCSFPSLPSLSNLTYPNHTTKTTTTRGNIAQLFYLKNDEAVVTAQSVLNKKKMPLIVTKKITNHHSFKKQQGASRLSIFYDDIEELIESSSPTVDFLIKYIL